MAAQDPPPRSGLLRRRPSPASTTPWLPSIMRCRFNRLSLVGIAFALGIHDKDAAATLVRSNESGPPCGSVILKLRKPPAAICRLGRWACPRLRSNDNKPRINSLKVNNCGREGGLPYSNLPCRAFEFGRSWYPSLSGGKPTFPICKSPQALFCFRPSRSESSDQISPPCH